jgi:hypothetical protein
MELQREAEHISAGNPADRSFSKAAPMISSKVLETDAAGVPRTDSPLNEPLLARLFGASPESLVPPNPKRES